VTEREPPPADHVHYWTVLVHMDGCHHYGTTFRCACGAHRAQGAERDFKRDVYASVWALPDDCGRCAALMGGARRKPRFDRTLEVGADEWIRTPL